jgi:hypothetical protein
VLVGLNDRIGWDSLIELRRKTFACSSRIENLFLILHADLGNMNQWDEGSDGGMKINVAHRLGCHEMVIKFASHGPPLDIHTSMLILASYIARQVSKESVQLMNRIWTSVEDEMRKDGLITNDQRFMNVCPPWLVGRVRDLVVAFGANVVRSYIENNEGMRLLVNKFEAELTVLG